MSYNRVMTLIIDMETKLTLFILEVSSKLSFQEVQQRTSLIVQMLLQEEA